MGEKEKDQLKLTNELTFFMSLGKSKISKSMFSPTLSRNSSSSEYNRSIPPERVVTMLSMLEFAQLNSKL